MQPEDTKVISADEIALYSRPVSAKLYTDKPEYFSTFIPRIHRDRRLSADATIQCQIDVFGKDAIGMVMGNLDTYYGDWVSHVYPFCSPERLDLVAYLREFAFIHDVRCRLPSNYSDCAVPPHLLHHAVSSCYYRGNFAPGFLDESRNKQVISKLMRRLVEIDKERGSEIIQQWESSKRSEKDYVERECQICETLEGFLALCYEMRGCQFAFASARFVYGVTLQKDEEESIRPLTELIMHILTIHNDYFSWQKEFDFYNASEEKRPMSNSVSLYMKWTGMTVQDAKAALRSVAIQKELEYLRQKEVFLNESPRSPGIQRWLAIMEHMVSGNLLWSITCPRYNQTASNQYIDHYEARIREGYAFYDDCTLSDSFVGYQVPPDKVVNKVSS